MIAFPWEILRLARQVRKRAGAVAELRDVQFHAVEHREPQVIDRRILRIFQMAALFDRSATAAREQDRKVVVIVRDRRRNCRCRTRSCNDPKVCRRLP